MSLRPRWVFLVFFVLTGLTLLALIFFGTTSQCLDESISSASIEHTKWMGLEFFILSCVNGFALFLVLEIVGCTFVVLVVLFGFVGCRPEIVKTNPPRLDRGDRTIHGKYTQDACVAKPSVCLM